MAMQRQIPERARLEDIQDHRLIKEMCMLEPRLRALLVSAAEESNPNMRWLAYADLKRKASQLVGFDASCEQLRTTAHYDAFLEALDLLLPDEREGLQ